MKNDMTGVPSPARMAARLRLRPASSPPGSPMVLLVDQDDDNRELLKLVFEVAGFAVAECRRGDEVLASVQQLLPELVVMNVRLAGEDGWSVCRRLRGKEPYLSQTPVILISASGEGTNEARAISVGGNRYFDQPFDVYDLARAAEALVAHQRRVQ